MKLISHAILYSLGKQFCSNVHGRKYPDKLCFLMGRNVVDRNVVDRNVMDRNVVDRNVVDRNVVGDAWCNG